MLAVVAGDRPAEGALVVDGWHVSVFDSTALIREAGHLLSPAERARFDAMTEAGGADLRRAAHVLKRIAAGTRLGVAPEAVPFVKGPAPMLAPPHDGVHVSLSHTRDAVAVAVADAPVGIDIEPLTARGDPVRLAARYFAAEEARAIAEARDAAFAFSWRWVAKEALLKARSLTLRRALATPIGAGPRDGGELPFVCIAGDTRITVFAPAPDFVCALAR